jgi:hypothetical protein
MTVQKEGHALTKLLHMPDATLKPRIDFSGDVKLSEPANENIGACLVAW